MGKTSFFRINISLKCDTFSESPLKTEHKNTVG